MTYLAKPPILALTNWFGSNVSHGWSYTKTGCKFTRIPTAGVTLRLSPGWGFAGWVAKSTPHLSISSDILQNAHTLLTGKKKLYPVISLHNGQFWRALDMESYPTRFIEDIAGCSGHDGYQEIGHVPEYLQNLLELSERHMATNYDLSTDAAFIRSMPQDWAYYDPTRQQTAQGFILSELLRGDTGAVRKFRARGDVPPVVLDDLSEDLDLYEANQHKLILLDAI